VYAKPAGNLISDCPWEVKAKEGFNIIRFGGDDIQKGVDTEHLARVSRDVIYRLRRGTP